MEQRLLQQQEEWSAYFRWRGYNPDQQLSLKLAWGKTPTRGILYLITFTAFKTLCMKQNKNLQNQKQNKNLQN
jgi:hypothetical protein